MPPLRAEPAEGVSGSGIAELLFLAYIWATSLLFLVLWTEARYWTYWTDQMSKVTGELEVRIEIQDDEKSEKKDEPREDKDTTDDYIKVE